MGILHQRSDTNQEYVHNLASTDVFMETYYQLLTSLAKFQYKKADFQYSSVIELQHLAATPIIPSCSLLNSFQWKLYASSFLQLKVKSYLSSTVMHSHLHQYLYFDPDTSDWLTASSQFYLKQGKVHLWMALFFKYMYHSLFYSV